MKKTLTLLLGMILVLGCTKDDVVVIPLVPLAPTKLIVADILATQVNLSWTDNSTTETGFKIQRKGTTGNYATVGTVGADITVYYDKGLAINTAYSYRVLSYNDGGDSITYSNEVVASTDAISVINTSEVINVRATSATVGGSVFGDGGSIITERGVVWSTSPNPTLAITTKAIDLNIFNSYSFSNTITGLNFSTKYYVRAYATNEAGTAYGTEVSFTTMDGVTTLTTDTPSNISAYSATVGGSILGDGGSNIIAKGVVWSTSPNPTIALITKINEGSGGARFSNIISELNIITKYYVRAYATNEKGTFYGAEVSFTTPPLLPTVTTKVTSISTTSATIEGTIIYNGTEWDKQRGVVWSTLANPTIALDTKMGTSTWSNSFFTSTIIGLNANTKYFVRAYATNSFGTAYGTEVIFTTSGPPITNGTQFWQNTNLNVSTYSDGTPIPQVTDGNQWIFLTTGAWCYYNNDPASGAIYGKLYNWYAVAGIWNEASKTDVTQRKKLAPTGYHVPSDAEWTTLINFLGGSIVAGGAMKETETTHWLSPNTDATNSSGFTGLPGGYRFWNGPFSTIGANGRWWSSSEYDKLNSWYRGLDYNSGNTIRDRYSMSLGNSVRCLRD